ncbi:MAG: methyltransferase domain-containing protein [Actinomycetota bacterium]|nr:methyltransferase domain-containing protein [Actinomycetota bacterium]
MPHTETYVDPLESAASHAGLGLPLPRTSSVGKARALAVRAGQVLVDRQVAFNHGVVNAIRELRQRTDATSASAGHANDAVAAVRTELAELREAIARLQTDGGLYRGQQGALVERMERIDARLSEAQTNATEMSEELSRSKQRQRSQQSLVELFLREVRRSQPAAPDTQTLVDLPDGNDELYQALEDTFRGSFDEVKERLAEYVPDVQKVASKGRVLDLGTGRGEWLELMAEAGVDAYGVDTNALAIERCQRRNLDVVDAELLQHLSGLPDSSLGAITGFHIAEHLPFEVLLELVDHCARVLAPGGLVVFESPNPVNVSVGSATFYLDPTHLRPLHPLLVEFLLKARGFDEVEVRYLHDSRPLELPAQAEHDRAALQPLVDRLNDLVFGAQDFAVVGHKVSV